MKNKFLRIFTLFLFVLLTSCTNVKQKEDIYIVYTSDVHCGVNENFTFPALKAYVDDLKAQHSYVTLVDGGDYLQGGTLGSVSKGEIIIDLMNEVGYDIVTYGNHEFDYNMGRLNELVSKMNFETVASNIRYSGKNVNFFENVPEYVIKDYDGIKVGFLGILTPETPTTSTPIYFMEDDEYVYDFYSKDNGEQLFNKVQSLVDELKKKKVDYVVAISHLGSGSHYEPYDSISLITNTSGIDVVLDGHSHSLIIEDKYQNKEGKDVILCSVGTQLEAIGQLIIATDGSISTMHIDQYNRKDEKVEEAIVKANQELDELLSQKIIDIDFDLNIADEQGIRMVRTRETNLADLVTDAYRETLGTDIVIANGGSIRATLTKGTITYNDILSVNPFQNSLSSCYATGQQILDVLEFSCQSIEGLYKFDDKAVGEFGGFLQVSGLKLTIDTSIESPVILDENGLYQGIDETKARRVSDVYVLENDQYVKIDPDKIYTVGSSRYVMFEAGDGNTVLKDCQPITQQGPVDALSIKEYLSSIGDKIEKYRQVDERIIIK